MFAVYLCAVGVLHSDCHIPHRPQDCAITACNPSAIKGKRAAISGVGGRNATAGMRKDLERLFSAMGVQIIGGPSLGISLTPEEWSSDVLTPEPGTLGALGAAVDDYLAALER